MKDYASIRKQRRTRYTAVFLCLSLLFLLLFFLNLGIGTVPLPPAALLSASKELLSASKELPSGGAKLSVSASILFKIRLPRALAAALLGGALSLSGFLLQTYFENPVAGPYVLGISAGAKMTVAITLVLLLRRLPRVSSVTLVIAAFFGALLCTGFILLIARRVRHVATLLVAGIMIGYICSAVSELVITFAEEADIVNLHGWSQGSFSGMDYGDVLVSAVVTAAGFLTALLLSKPMGALRLGETYAKTAGVELKKTRRRIILLSSVLSATVTAFAGPVSFVGIAVPVLMKRLLRTSEPRVIIPGCMVGGGAFCLFCDLLSRTLFSPTELNISTVTAVFGAPVVIAALLSKKRDNG